MEKTVIIINGPGGAGKDTVCAAVAEKYPTVVFSTIDIIKTIALAGGWTAGDKSLPARKLLSDLKRAFTEYNDLPNRSALDAYRAFLSDDNVFLFVHIREPEEIRKFRASVDIRCVTLLVRSRRVAEGQFGNASDDGVENYPYDFVYENDRPLEAAGEDFLRFFTREVMGESAQT